MDINGINPYLAARIGRYRADELAREAARSRQARLFRRKKKS